MFWTILALLLMVVLSGFISYYGDLQGRRWGKRRVSWFGLRPKYTAIIITSLTGGAIALLSIVTVLIAFPTVREVILNGERLIRENKRALEENRQLNQSLASERKVQTRELEILTASQKKFSDQLKIKKLEVEAARKDVVIAQQKLAPMQEKVTQLQTKQAQLETTLKQEQAAIGRKSVELQAKIEDNKRAAEINASFVQRIQASTQQQQRLSANIKVLEAGNKELQQKKEDYERRIANQSQNLLKITHENDALMEVNKSLLTENSKLEVGNRAGKMDLENQKRELKQVQEQLARSRTELDQAVTNLAGAGQTFTQSYHALRQGEINLRVGAELARQVVDGKQNSGTVRKQLVQLLEAASDTASVYGAARGDNNRAVRIISKKVVSQFDTQDIDESASLNALAEVIANGSKPVLVISTSLNNSLRGEQAVIELRQYPVSRVFDKEEVVAARVIDANQPAQRVKEAIADFLQQNVKNAAVRAGSIPHVNPETGRKEIGVYDSIALGQLADRVKRMGGNVLLKAVAAEAITSADPLDDAHLRFEVVRSPQG